MFKISIDIYALIGILSIAFILLIAMILIFIAYMCHDKRKYKSIDKFNEQTSDKFKTYNDNLEEYNKNIEKSGVNHNRNNDHDIKSELNFLQFVISYFKPSNRKSIGGSK